MTAALVRIVVGHVPLVGDEFPDGMADYHEWITLGDRIKADSRGYASPRMVSANWTKWICNNGGCAAIAFVHDDLIRNALGEATA